MGSSTQTPDIGKPGEQVDQEQPGDEAIRKHLDDTAVDGDPAVDELPSRTELWTAVQNLQETVETQSEQIDRLQSELQDVQQTSKSVQDVLSEMEEESFGGEVGADVIQKMANFPEHSTKTDARATQLFRKVTEKRRVGDPITSSKVVEWLGLDTANPSQTAKRVMQRLKDLRDDGYYVGTVEIGKHRGRNAIWLRSEE